MKLTTHCKFCKSEISLNAYINDRVELEMKKGKEIPLNCKECMKKSNYHVNSFLAEKSLSHKIFLLSTVFGLTSALIFSEFYVLSLGIYFYGGVFLLPSVAYGIITKQYMVKLNSFNRFKVKE
ncbi:MAG: hypothetical protein JXQ93_00915 [Flavobacteriaceae bacterium]